MSFKQVIMSTREHMEGFKFGDNASEFSEELFEEAQPDPDLEGIYKSEFKNLGILKSPSKDEWRNRLSVNKSGPQDSEVRKSLIEDFLKKRKSGEIKEDNERSEVHNNLIPIEVIPETVQERMNWLMEIIGSSEKSALYITEVENVNGKIPYYFCVYFAKLKILVIFNQGNKRSNYVIRNCQNINEFKKIGPDLFHANSLRFRILDLRTQLKATWQDKVARFIGAEIKEPPAVSTKSKSPLAEENIDERREPNETLKKNTSRLSDLKELIEGISLQRKINLAGTNDDRNRVFEDLDFLINRGYTQREIATVLGTSIDPGGGVRTIQDAVNLMFP